MEIIIGCDHAGFALKEKIKRHLENQFYHVIDLTPKLIEGDDYPDIAFKVAKKVIATNNIKPKKPKQKSSKNNLINPHITEQETKGILICGSGTGMVIAANRIKGARASVLYDTYSAKMSRIDNNSNIACLRARKFFAYKETKLLDLWLTTKFSNNPRHIRRIQKLDHK